MRSKTAADGAACFVRVNWVAATLHAPSFSGAARIAAIEKHRLTSAVDKGRQRFHRGSARGDVDRPDNSRLISQDRGRDA
jgi:hypothetical protein